MKNKPWKPSTGFMKAWAVILLNIFVWTVIFAILSAALTETTNPFPYS